MSFFSHLFGGARPAQPLPYDPSSPEGLAARWVQWVASFGPMRNPVADRTGADAAVNQPEDVFFLAGTFGDAVERRCTVPAGRPLFFPAFNMWHWPADQPPPHLPHAHGELFVDGVPTELDVLATPVPFEVAGARGNPATGRNKPIPVTVWGLWRRLDPLPPGPHEIRFAGGDGHGFGVAARYEIQVE